MNKHCLALIIVLVPLIVTGCAYDYHPPHLPEPDANSQPELGKIAIFSSLLPPEIRFEGLARRKAEGASKDVEAAFFGCMSKIGNGCSGSNCGASMVVWIGICGIVGTVGGVVGTVAAPDIKKVTAAENSVVSSLDTTIIQESLRDQVVATAIANGASLVPVPSTSRMQPDGEPRDYRRLALSGVKTVIEVALIRVSIVGGGFNPRMQLQMTARARLISTSDSAEFFSYDYDYFSKEELKFDEWSSNHAERLLQSLQIGYKSLGKDIYENIHYRYPDHSL